MEQILTIGLFPTKDMNGMKVTKIQQEALILQKLYGIFLKKFDMNGFKN